MQKVTAFVKCLHSCCQSPTHKQDVRLGVADMEARDVIILLNGRESKNESGYRNAARRTEQTE